MLALARGDSGAARRALADSNRKGADREQKTDAVYLGFAWNDTRPLEAEARYHLGDYQETIDLLKSFNESQLYRRGFDSRWGLLGRVHLLRGLAYEHLGEAVRAATEFKHVVTAWRGAEEPLLTFVQQAQAGLARLKGAGERIGTTTGKEEQIKVN